MDATSSLCPSGLRGATQVRIASAAWVRIPLVTFWPGWAIRGTVVSHDVRQGETKAGATPKRPAPIRRTRSGKKVTVGVHDMLCNGTGPECAVRCAVSRLIRGPCEVEPRTRRTEQHWARRQQRPYEASRRCTMQAERRAARTRPGCPLPLPKAPADPCGPSPRPLADIDPHPLVELLPALEARPRTTRLSLCM